MTIRGIIYRDEYMDTMLPNSYVELWVKKEI